VHGDDVVELSEGIVFDGNDRAVVAGIVDEDIDLPEFRAGFVDNTDTIRLVSKIGKGVVRAVRNTEAPSAVKTWAMARPMPRPEPVIRATWSLRSIGRRE
jgi:hypothetical protein